ncbi:MAG: hypothetical protein ABI588_01845 [Arenimonas sp.]
MIRSLLLVAVLLGLSACGKPASKDAAKAPADSAAASASAATMPAGATATATPGSTTQPPLPELGEFKLVSVLMGNAVDAEHVVIRDTRQFGTKDAIYASVLSIGPHQGLKLSAEWLAPDGSSIAKSEQPIVPASDLATTFNIRNPAGWPAGDYQLRVAINGHTQRTESFTVR